MECCMVLLQSSAMLIFLTFHAMEDHRFSSLSSYRATAAVPTRLKLWFLFLFWSSSSQSLKGSCHTLQCNLGHMASLPPRLVYSFALLPPHWPWQACQAVLVSLPPLYHADCSPQPDVQALGEQGVFFTLIPSRVFWLPFRVEMHDGSLLYSCLPMKYWKSWFPGHKFDQTELDI